MKQNFYEDSDGFCGRIKEAVSIIGNTNITAKKTGVTPSSVSRWVKGESDPSRTNLIRIAAAAGVNIAWLAIGEGPKFIGDRVNACAESVADSSDSPQVWDSLGNPVDIDEFVFIPRYNVKAAAGHGYANSDHKSTLRMAFRKFWIDNYLRANPADLSVISVKGDSMTGVLEDGDNILVNHAQNRPGNGLYVVRIGEDLIVKRIQAMPGGKLLLTSANEAYAPFEIDAKDQDSDVQIIGRVEWFGRQI